MDNMDKYERRRLRILEWRDDQCNRSVAGLARRIDRDCSSVSRMLYVDGKAGKKRIAGASMVFFLQRYHWVLTRQLPVGNILPNGSRVHQAPHPGHGEFRCSPLDRIKRIAGVFGKATTGRSAARRAVAVERLRRKACRLAPIHSKKDRSPGQRALNSSRRHHRKPSRRAKDGWKDWLPGGEVTINQQRSIRMTTEANEAQETSTESAEEAAIQPVADTDEDVESIPVTDTSDFIETDDLADTETPAETADA